MVNNKEKKKKQKKESKNLFRERVDLKITITLMFLCCFGLLMLYSASAYECSMDARCNYDSAYYLKRQAIFMIMGVLAILVIRVIDYHMVLKLVIPIHVIATLSIFLVYSPLGVMVKGARRWINLGFIQFQIAELIKITTIMFLAYMVHKYYRAQKSTGATVRMWLGGGIPAIMVFAITDDLSSAAVILGVTFLTSFICMKTYKIHAFIAVVVIIAVGVYIYSIASNLPTPEELEMANFRVGRIAAFIDPERYADDQGYQVLQSLYAVASGGIFGKGLGNSTQKLGAIPEAQNDMIFSVICEELGLFGAIILIGLFAYLCFNIVKVTHASRDIFGSVLVMGVFLHFGIQTIINIAVNLNCMPNTGIGLPLISYGGTAILCQMAEIGIVYSVERNNRLYAARKVLGQENK